MPLLPSLSAPLVIKQGEFSLVFEAQTPPYSSAHYLIQGVSLDRGTIKWFLEQDGVDFDDRVSDFELARLANLVLKGNKEGPKGSISFIDQSFGVHYNSQTDMFVVCFTIGSSDELIGKVATTNQLKSRKDFIYILALSVPVQMRLKRSPLYTSFSSKIGGHQ